MERIIEMNIHEISHNIIGMAMRVHSFFGPGFLEEVYKNALLVELEKSGLKYEKEAILDINYKGTTIGHYKADIIVERKIIVELKSVNAIIPIHETQLVHYLNATNINDCLLLNFGSKSLQFKHKYK